MSCEAVAKVPLLDDNTGLSWRDRHIAIGSEEPIGKTSMRVPTLPVPWIAPAARLGEFVKSLQAIPAMFKDYQSAWAA